MREIDEQRQEMLTEAEHEAEAHKQKLFAQARQEVEQIRQKWAESLKREKETFLENLKQRLVQEIFAISRRALQGNGEPGVGAAGGGGFSGSPPATGPGRTGRPSRTPSRRRGASCSSPPRLSCPRKLRQKIAAQVKEQFGQGLALRFATSGELLAGIEMLTSSRKIAWSLGNFLDTLEEDLSQAFEELEKSEGA